MLDILRTYLVDATTPEMLDQIDNAHAVFDRLGLETTDQGFEELLMLDDETDPGNTLQSIINLTINLQRSLLMQHQIRTQDACPMQMSTDFLNVLIDVVNNEHAHDLIQICNQPKNAEEIFAEVCEFMTEHSAEDVLPWLEFVSAAIPKQIITLLDQDEIRDDDEADRIFKHERIAAFKGFMDLCRQHEALVQKLIYEGVDAGFPFLMYINLIGRNFETLDVDGCAINLIGMALLSSDGFVNPATTIAEHLDNLIADPEMLTRVNIKVRALLLQLAQVPHA